MEANTLSHFVLADDDADDRSLFQEALTEVAPNSQLTTVNNGVALTQFLSKSEVDMVFLDLNMPLKNGIDCIKWIRELKEFRHLLVVAYSSAFDQVEINKAYAYGVHLYFIKPAKIGHLKEDLRRLFALNWDDPITITSNHFVRNIYVAFNCKRGEDFTAHTAT